MATGDKVTIRELRNLGPACEQDLQAAGIHTAADLRRLGPEQAFIQMLMARKQAGRSAKRCNAAYLYALYGAIHEVDWRQIPDDKNKKAHTSLTA